MKWIKTTQKSVPLLSRYIATKYSLNRYISISCLHNIKINQYKYINSSEQVQAFFSKEELDKLYFLLWEKIISGKINEFLKDYKDVGLELINFSKVLKNKNLSKISINNLKHLFEFWIHKYAKFIGYVYNGNFCVNIAAKKLLEKLGKENEDEEFRILIEPVEGTNIKRRREEINTVIKEIKNKELETLFLGENSEYNLPHKIVGKLTDIHEKYRYLGSIFLTSNNYPYFDDFLKELKYLFSSNGLPEENLKERKSKIIKKLNLNKETKDLIEKLTLLVFYRTELLSYIQKAEYYSVGLLEEIARRLDIPYKHLVYLTSEEILESLSSQKLIIPVNQIEKRFENYYIKLNKERVSFSFPEKSNNREKTILELKGTPASSGKVIGKVRIIRNSSEITKMQNGEILVTFMTTPDFVMAMQKATAIITNDGGITCHAAIISRELGVPCIVGTEIATKVLKDGYLVEVDATNGVIKILNKKTDYNKK